MLNSGRTKITEQLRYMFFHYMARGLKLHDQLVLNEEIGMKITQQGSIFVQNLKRMLLFDIQYLLPQSVRQGVFINLFYMTTPMIPMNRKARFSDYVA